MTRHVAIALATVLSGSSLACDLKSSSSAAPTSPATITVPSASTSYIGTWSTASTAVTASQLAGRCRNFTWTVNAQTATEISGQVNADCLDPTIPVTATAVGVLTSSTSGAVSITGSGAVPNTGPCTFLVTGTGSLAEDVIQIGYQGSSCLGDFSGHVTLHRGSVPGVF